MFLVLCLGVFAVAFWLSAMAAETFMRSSGERALAPGVRVGFGFLLLLVYFSAAWQVLSAQQAWILGIALLALHAWARFGIASGAAWLASPGRLWRGYRGAFLGFLGAALLFFAPLAVTQTYGPFTEGGGDVSIYADTSKYMVDHGLTEFGLPSRTVEDFGRNLDEFVKQGGGARPGADQSPLMNPPYPEYGAYRILVTRTMSPYLYAPYAMLSFLAGETNYPVFYGIECFVYGCLLAAIWGFFIRYGRRIAFAGVVLGACSHSLVSIFYNTYAAQAIAVAMSALALAALRDVRPWSMAALRTYGCVLAVTWIMYVHYLSVVLPIVCVALVPAAAAGGPARPVEAAHAGARRVASGLLPAAFLLALATLAWAGTLKSWHIGSILVQGAMAAKVSKEVLTYMGVPVQAFGTQWLAFVFGLASQQHFMPYVREWSSYLYVLRVGNAAGVAAFAVGLVAMVRWVISRRMSWRPALQDLAIYVAAVTTIAIHFYLVRNSLYTQAKGAQNVLVLVLTVLLLPLALVERDLPAGTIPRMLRRVLEASLVVFVAAMVLVRGSFGWRLALGLDRTGILDRSFFAEADRIRASDPKPLVLFEPRQSADLYTSNEPFFGERMLPTREMVLQKSIIPETGYYDSRIAMAVEFIEPADLPHVWTLRARRVPRWALAWRLRGMLQQMPYVDTWQAERLVDSHAPRLVLSGDTFERPYGELFLGAQKGAARAPFNFMRNGIVSLYLPGRAARVEVEMQPREGDYGLLEPEVRRRFEAGEFGPDARMATTGKVVRLSYAIGATGVASLRMIARAKGEFFVNVKVDGTDLE